MFIKPFITKENFKGIGEKFLITILVICGVFFTMLFIFRAPMTPEKKFEIADLITGDTYLLTEDDFYFSGSDIVIKKQGQKIIQFTKYTYKPL
jgi:uncharacterized protein YpmB